MYNFILDMDLKKYTESAQLQTIDGNEAISLCIFNVRRETCTHLKKILKRDFYTISDLLCMKAPPINDQMPLKDRKINI